jgi:hypothetical protein
MNALDYTIPMNIPQRNVALSSLVRQENRAQAQDLRAGFEFGQKVMAQRSDALENNQIKGLIPLYTKDDGTFDRDGYLQAVTAINPTKGTKLASEWGKIDYQKTLQAKAKQSVMDGAMDIAQKQVGVYVNSLDYLSKMMDDIDKNFNRDLPEYNPDLGALKWQNVKDVASKMRTVDPSGAEIQGIQVPDSYTPMYRQTIGAMRDSMLKTLDKLQPKETDAQRAAREFDEMMAVVNDQSADTASKAEAVMKYSTVHRGSWQSISTMLPLALKAEIEKRYKMSEAGALGGTSPRTIGPSATKAAVTQSIKLQDTKIASANAAMQILHRDPATGKFTVPTPQQATELALACARLVSPTGQVAENLVNELQQKTLMENISRAVAFFGGKTAGTTQQNLENIEAFINREGALAEKQRNTMAGGQLIHFEPSGATHGESTGGFIIEEIQ